MHRDHTVVDVGGVVSIRPPRLQQLCHASLRSCGLTAHFLARQSVWWVGVRGQGRGPRLPGKEQSPARLEHYFLPLCCALAYGRPIQHHRNPPVFVIGGGERKGDGVGWVGGLLGVILCVASVFWGAEKRGATLYRLRKTVGRIYFKRP